MAPSGEWRVSGEPAWRSILAPAPAAGPALAVKAEAPAALPHGTATPGAGQANGATANNIFGVHAKALPLIAHVVCVFGTSIASDARCQLSQVYFMSCTICYG